MATSKKLMIIDTDPGVDDAFAIIIALSEYAKQRGWDVLGITAVHGNTHIENVCSNLIKILNTCDRLDVPVYRGCSDGILKNKHRGHDFHGEDGFGNVAHTISHGEGRVQDKHAVDFLLQASKDHIGEITLVALGPLTNLAVAHTMDQDFTKRLKNLYVMGGNIEGQGNQTISAEFNFICDPEAAHIVLMESKCPLTLIPWEVSFRFGFTWCWYNQWLSKECPKVKMLKNIQENQIKRMKETAPEYYCCDLYTMAVVIDDSVVRQRKNRYVTVELKGEFTRGQCVVETRPWITGEANVDVITEFDLEKLRKVLELSV